jgi:transcriptional regulator with XRE-family HTH domain
MASRKRGNIVGERVRVARATAKPPITQEDLVARLQVQGLSYMDQAKVSRIESGERPVVDFELLELSHALNVSVPWLLGQNSPD